MSSPAATCFEVLLRLGVLCVLAALCDAASSTVCVNGVCRTSSSTTTISAGAIAGIVIASIIVVIVIPCVVLCVCCGVFAKLMGRSGGANRQPGAVMTTTAYPGGVPVAGQPNPAFQAGAYPAQAGAYPAQAGAYPAQAQPPPAYPPGQQYQYTQSTAEVVTKS